MATVTPPSIASPPAFPAIGDAAYNTLAYAWASALPTFGTEVAAVAVNVKANADDAATSGATATAQAALATAQAAAAAASATAASATAGASAWVNGGTYDLNANAISGVDHQTYRKITASSVTVIDPSADLTNWVKIGSGSGLTVTVVSGTTQTALAGYHYILTNVAATTVTLPASPTVGGTVWVTVTNSLTTNVIARNGETIMGVAEDMTIDNQNATVELRFVDSSWRLV
jgi:hypothetical protein